MEKNGSFLSRYGLRLFGWTVAIISLVVAFFPVLAKYSALIAPDSMPFFAYPWRTVKVEELLSSGTFTPHVLYWLLLHPLYAHELTFMGDSIVLALAGVYYLRSQRVHPLAAWCGGLALGLSGYTFTLFCAGHRGYFHMFSCAVWAFGLIARGFETRRLFYFAMLGLVFAWGVSYQPDVLLLVGALAAFYVLWVTAKGKAGDVSRMPNAESPREAKVQGAGCGGIWKTVVGVWPRFLVSVMVLALAGFNGIRSAATTQIANRDVQIAGAAGQRGSGVEPTGKKTAAEKRERWIFATNWSLPPEDVLEFVVPGVFGNESLQGDYPYWGRLGRPDDSVFQKGRMVPNYRGHTVYLGLIPVLFSLLAVFALFASPNEAKGVSPSPERLAPLVFRSDVPFWCVVWVVCLILAMGRYTPLYKFFYAIPYMDYIRAPVKFHHLAEVATAFLAGFGMDAFLRAGRPEMRRKLLWLAVGMAGVLLVAALVAVVAKPLTIRYITDLGMGQVAETLCGYTLRNLMRALGLAALVAGLAFVAMRRGSERALVGIGCVLVAVLALDQAFVAQRYVKAMNVEPFYTENAVVRALAKLNGGEGSRVVNYATQNTLQDWFSSSLAMKGIRNLAPSQNDRDTAYGRLFMGLQNDPVRLWQMLHAQAVIVPRRGIEGLLRSGVLRSLLDFELGAGVVRQSLQPSEKTLTLASIRTAENSPRFIADWQGGVPEAKQVDAVINGRQTVSDAPSPAGKKDPVEGEVHVLASLAQPGSLATRIQVSAKCPGLLVFDDRTKDKQEILIDGKSVPVYVADAVWTAALVPAGEHVVVLRQQRMTAVLLMSVLTTLAVLGWGGRVFLSDKSVPGSGAVA